VVGLSETLHRELRAERSPIGVSVLCPGAIDTRIVDSDRNRPEASARDHELTDEEQQFREGARDRLGSKGLSPEVVADLVLGAIRDPRFWIVTHEDWLDVLAKRVEGMRNGGRLTSGFGG
jgi:NAD(P)-dependent dehydrogenase (short-subunit alcohol dehydrogenase family)